MQQRDVRVGASACFVYDAYGTPFNSNVCELLWNGRKQEH